MQLGTLQFVNTAVPDGLYLIDYCPHKCSAIQSSRAHRGLFAPDMYMTFAKHGS